MLKRLARNEGAKVQLLQILFDLWRNHPQMLVVLIDKCIRAQIVDPGSVARWIFSPEMANYFHRCYIWEVPKINFINIGWLLAQRPRTLVQKTKT